MTTPVELAETLGPYRAGEIPEPWTHTYRDADGAALDLTAGFAAKVAWRLNRGAQHVADAVVTGPAAGEVTYVWQAADLAAPGLIEGEMWVANGTNRYAVAFRLPVLPPLGGPAPEA